MESVSKQRWTEAQQHELEFWQTRLGTGPYRDLDLPAYWAEQLALFGTYGRGFAGLRVVDIGCGPVGLIHFVEGAAERVQIDPLLDRYENRLRLPEPQLSLVGEAERLPLAAASVDAAICFNALDHMRDPDAALRELVRVVRPGGRMLLMVHTFPQWAMPLMWADRMHPHHWTAKGFAEAVGRHARVMHAKTAQRRFEMPMAEWLVPKNWKYAAANVVLSSTYVAAVV